MKTDIIRLEIGTWYLSLRLRDIHRCTSTFSDMVCNQKNKTNSVIKKLKSCHSLRCSRYAPCLWKTKTRHNFSKTPPFSAVLSEVISIYTYISYLLQFFCNLFPVYSHVTQTDLTLDVFRPKLYIHLLFLPCVFMFHSCAL